MFAFNKSQTGDDVLVISFLQTIVHISNSIEHTNFILNTNIQQHDVHLMIKMKVTLTDYKGRRCRPKVTKMNKWSYLEIVTITDIIPGTKVQYNR